MGKVLNLFMYVVVFQVKMKAVWEKMLKLKILKLVV